MKPFNLRSNVYNCSFVVCIFLRLQLFGRLILLPYSGKRGRQERSLSVGSPAWANLRHKAKIRPEATPTRELSTTRSSRFSLSFNFPTEILNKFLMYYTRATYPARLTPFDLILEVFQEQNKFRLQNERGTNPDHPVVQFVFRHCNDWQSVCQQHSLGVSTNKPRMCDPISRAV